PITAQPYSQRIFLRISLTAWTDYSISPRHCPSVSPHCSNNLRWYRNFNLLSFHYAFRPRVRSRLTLSGRAFLRKPWAFGGQDSHLSFRYSYRHSHLNTVHQSSRSSFNPYSTLPYPST